MNKIDTFMRRMGRIGIDLRLSMNYPWIYLTHVNGKKVDELFMANHGFTIAFMPIRENQELQFTDIGRIFDLIRKYIKAGV